MGCGGRLPLLDRERFATGKPGACRPAPTSRRASHRWTQTGTDIACRFALNSPSFKVWRTAAPDYQSNPLQIPTDSLDIRSNRLPFPTGSPSRSCIRKPAVMPRKPTLAAHCRTPLRFVIVQTRADAIRAFSSEIQPKKRRPIKVKIGVD
jgi:hypothetical protein